MYIFAGGFHERGEGGAKAGSAGLEVGVRVGGGDFEAVGVVFAYEGTEGWDSFEEVGDFVEGSETAEAFKWGDGDGHLGFVVVIWVVLRVFGVELSGELLVGMGLD